MNAQENIPDLDSISEKYVQLVLAVGVHDPDYVDAYYGPPESKEKAASQKLSYEQIGKDAELLLEQMKTIILSTDPMARLRYEFLQKQLQSLRAFTEMRSGKKFSFDEESLALYDAVSPHFSEDHFAELVREIEAQLPGQGETAARYETFQKQFIIPKEKLDVVFQAALTECRSRTKQFMTLPGDESFDVEYVTSQPWSGYNWYKGNFHSVIQINTDLPVYIDRAVNLAGHEGYPGHHVYNVLLEQELVRKRNWKEFSVYPLFSPQSFIAEGTANYGVEILFSNEERIEFEESVIFPAAGIDKALAVQYYRIRRLVEKLGYAGNEAARHFLDGEWSEQQVVDWLQKYSFSSPERAIQRIKFFKKYRSYVINYNLGKDLVAQYIDAHSRDHTERWLLLANMLSSPILPSGLS